MIDTDLHLKAICSFPVRTNHYTSIVDEEVEFGLSCRREHSEVKLCGFKFASCVQFSEEQTGQPLLMASANSLIELVSAKSSFMQTTFSLPELSMTSLTAACALSMSRQAMMTFAPTTEIYTGVKYNSICNICINWFYVCSHRHTQDMHVIWAKSDT